MSTSGPGEAPDLREHLQTTLGAAYSVTRELGGGGMSRVFMAEEATLRRWVEAQAAAARTRRGRFLPSVANPCTTCRQHG